MPPAQNSHDPSLTDTPVVETDAGPGRVPGRSGGKTARGDSERRCIATMEARAPADMIRFVLSPEAEVTPDLAGRLPGRGAWVAANREAISTALKKGAFSRAFKTQAKAAPNLADTVDTLLEKRVLDMLGLAMSAGDLILGFEQVREALRSNRPACLIEASDGAEDGRSKLLGLSRAIYVDDGLEPPVVGCFSAEQLGMALGRGRVIHACLKQGRFAHVWMGELARLAGFRRVGLNEGRIAEGRAQTDPLADSGQRHGDTRHGTDS